MHAVLPSQLAFSASVSREPSTCPSILHGSLARGTHPMTRRPHWHAHSLGMARKHGNQVLFYFLYELDLKPKKSQGTQGAGELAWCGSISEYLLSFDNPPPNYRKLKKHTWIIVVSWLFPYGSTFGLVFLSFIHSC